MTEVFFATNRSEPRAQGDSFGGRFNSDGPHFYEVGRAKVTWQSSDALGRPTSPDDYSISFQLQASTRPENELPGDTPELHRKRADGEVPGSVALFSDLRRQMAETGRDVILYIHGFANDFENSVARAAWLREVYQIKRGDAEPFHPFVFVFSWPSDGKTIPPWKYASDRDDAAMSGVAMARALRRFVEFLNEGERCEGKVHLMAHSMGNWALRHAILGMRALLEGQRLPKIFDNVFLLAADEDEDCFESNEKLGILPEIARKIHVYHSSGDRALEVSDKTKFNMDRLGSAGPRTFSGISNRITAIDCGDVDSTTFSHGNHQYYRLRQEVIADITTVLGGEKHPDEFEGRKVIEPGRRYRIIG